MRDKIVQELAYKYAQFIDDRAFERLALHLHPEGVLARVWEHDVLHRHHQLGARGRLSVTGRAHFGFAFDREGDVAFVVLEIRLEEITPVVDGWQGPPPREICIVMMSAIGDGFSTVPTTQ